MTWFKVDDNLHGHSKAVGAGNAAMGLWVRAGSWCGDHLTNGFVPMAIAQSMGNSREIAALIRERLWEEVDGGYHFHEWEQRQPTREEVLADRAKTAERVRRFRQRKYDESNGVTNGVSSNVGTASPSPSPSPSLSSSSVVSHSPDVPRASQNDDRLDLDKIAAQLGTDVDWAKRVADDVLSRGNGVTQPTRYVLAAIASEPERYRPTKGPPRLADLCRHALPAPCPVCAEETRP